MDEALDELAALLAKAYFRHKRTIESRDLALESARVQSVHVAVNEYSKEAGERYE